MLVENEPVRKRLRKRQKLTQILSSRSYKRFSFHIKSIKSCDIVEAKNTDTRCHISLLFIPFERSVLITYSLLPMSSTFLPMLSWLVHSADWDVLHPVWRQLIFPPFFWSHAWPGCNFPAVYPNVFAVLGTVFVCLLACFNWFEDLICDDKVKTNNYSALFWHFFLTKEIIIAELS